MFEYPVPDKIFIFCTDKKIENHMKLKSITKNIISRSVQRKLSSKYNMDNYFKKIFKKNQLLHNFFLKKTFAWFTFIVIFFSRRNSFPNEVLSTENPYAEKKRKNIWKISSCVFGVVMWVVIAEMISIPVYHPPISL